MTNKNTVYFIIVNYNGSEDTIKLLQSIESLSHSGITLHAIVVDNSSDADDINTINNYSTDLQWVTIILSKSNVGYFPAFNIALDHISGKLPAPVILCNNDLIFDKSFLKKYFNASYSNDVYVIAPNVITSDGFYQNPHLISKVPSWRKYIYDLYFYSYFMAVLFKRMSGALKIFHRKSTTLNLQESQYIHMGIGACYILRPVFFENFNKLDGRVFLGGEEALLAGQIEKIGGRTFFDNQLIVHHAEGISFSKMPQRWRYECSKRSYKIYKKYL